MLEGSHRDIVYELFWEYYYFNAEIDGLVKAELGGRNREDIQTIAKLRTELEDKEQNLHTQEVSFSQHRTSTHKR